MSATLSTAQRQDVRFQRFVGISIGLHAVVLVAALVVVRWPIRQPIRTPITFELVGAPARGVPGPPKSPPASQTESPAPAPVTPTPPEPTPSPVLPVPGPAVVKPAPPQPTTQQTKPAVPSAAAPSTKAPPSTLPPGPTSGQPTGDTLSVGGQGGTPSAMTLWLSRVKFQVERNWRAPPGLAGVENAPEVVFDVALDGRPGRPRLRVKSGNEMLDRLALRAISAVDAFPPVPGSWQGQTVAVRYVLEYAH